MTDLNQHSPSVPSDIALSEPSSRLSITQLWNMSLGYLGIQVAWGLQVANISALFEFLGARSQQLPLLWIAAPMSGFLIQPLVGYWSDRTNMSLGRRRPYFLIGALFSIIALVLIPESTQLWFAVLLVWALDIFANVCMTPYRSFVVDTVPDFQQTQAFSMQSLALGLGAVIASILPWSLTHVLRLEGTQMRGALPLSVTLSFYIGAAILAITTAWTVWTAPPDRPQEMIAASSSPLMSPGEALLKMPRIMKQLAWVKGLSWGGLFCFFLYFPPAVARNIFGAQFETSDLYASGIEWAGLCIALLNLVCCGAALGLPVLAKNLSLSMLHSLCLLVGAFSLISLHWVHSPVGLLFPICGVGIALASMLSLPYAMLTDAIPAEENGLYMGIFNCFIVIPQILVSVTLGAVVSHGLGGDRMSAIVLGGGCMLLASGYSAFLNEAPTTEQSEALV